MADGHCLPRTLRRVARAGSIIGLSTLPPYPRSRLCRRSDFAGQEELDYGRGRFDRDLRMRVMLAFAVACWSQSVVNAQPLAPGLGATPSVAQHFEAKGRKSFVAFHPAPEEAPNSGVQDAEAK